MKKLFIVGTQGIPARYGGLETFAEQIAIRLVDRGHPVYVTCEYNSNGQSNFSSYKNVKLIHINAPNNNLRTIVADFKALLKCCKLSNPGDIIYLQGYGVGFFAWPIIKWIKIKGVEFWINPDGLEWKRPRWSFWTRKFLQFSEWFLIKRANKIICDARAIKDHHKSKYKTSSGRMKVIEYGAPIIKENDIPSDIITKRNNYLKKYMLNPGEYFTYVGRFVSDNNMELIVRGMLDDRIKRKLLILAKHNQSDKFFKKLYHLANESGNTEKIIFTGGVYDQQFLQAIRIGEFAYLHGHEVGGTNPALVEAMGLGSLIVAIDTIFNREVLCDAGFYFEKDVESFVKAILKVESLSEDNIQMYRDRAIRRVREHYNWNRIANLYDNLLNGT